VAKKTTAQSLDELFDVFVRVLRERLESGEATAADLNVVRAFLKENGIEFVGEATDAEERQRLADLLPFKADEAARA